MLLLAVALVASSMDTLQSAIASLVVTWIGEGNLAAGVLAATFPGGVPTLAPFLAALLASSFLSLLFAWLKPSAQTDAIGPMPTDLVDHQLQNQLRSQDPA